MAKRQVRPDFDGGFERFGNRVKKIAADTAIARINATPGREKEFGNTLWNVIGDVPNAPKTTKPVPMTQHEQAVQHLFQGYAEIYTTLRALRQSQYFLNVTENSFAATRRKISKTEFQRYHFEKWLSEIYILQMRLETFFNKIARRYKGNAGIVQQANRALISIEQSFEKIKVTRGFHVHEARYQDDVLNRMDLIELLSRGVRKKEWKALVVGIYYRETQKQLRKRLRESTQFFDAIVDACFHHLHPHVFDGDGNFLLSQPNEAASA